ncbi:ATP-binding protein [Shewanella olleyana]|uniref:ATP-binding protein n=1 Tax=Shewanella olleyana TaxID=135626 RepID=UPI00201022EA|nr:ATP-binding protein [Shewanella olleyana]MCL1065480.1 ATP-binding protein [Shewanella olleyana]
MQLSFKPKKRLLARMFITSLTIIALVGFGLAWSVTILHAQNSYNQETSQLIAEMPQIAAELREHNLIPADNSWLNDNNKQKRYMMASCTQSFDDVWISSLATDRGLNNICQRFESIADTSPPYYLTMSDEKSYFAYLLPVELNQTQYNMVVLKDADSVENEFKRFKKLTYLRLAVVMLLAFILLISAAYWCLRPMGRLKSELQAIGEGKKESLSNGYPHELEGVTQALNQLLTQSSEQQERYQNAMNDLAHSLKTRLAAVHAITDDKLLSKADASEKIMQQVGQMDQLVKYQLKRALVGRQGLVHEQTSVAPMVEQLSQMLFKIYREKGVRFSTNIEPKVSFPINKGDLMELCGNLMENAFRLSISEVIISAHIDQDGNAVLIVEDDGPGVEDALKERIIQRGVRADTQSPGQGIGLAVCNEIVSSYHGLLSITESHLQGAKFTIKIPPQ